MEIRIGSIVRDDYGQYGTVLNLTDGEPPLVWWTTGEVSEYAGEVPLTVLS